MSFKLLDRFKDADFIEIIKGSSSSFLFRIFGLFLGYVLTIIIAQFYGAQGLGDYVLAITVLKLFTLISKLGIDTSSIRFIASFSSQKKWLSINDFRNKIFYTLCFTSLICSLLMYFFADSISSLVNTKESFIKINAFFLMPLVFFMVNYQSLRGLKKIAEFSFFYRASQSLFAIISILILYQFIDSSIVPIYAYLTSLVIVSLLSFLSFRFWLKKKSNGHKEANLEILKYSTIFKVSLPLMFAQSVQFLMAWTDKLMIGGMLNSEAVGIYHTAFKLSMFSAIALMSINSIASPKFAEKFYNNDFIGLKKISNQSTKLIFVSSIPLIIISFLFPKLLLGIFGKEFVSGTIAFLILSVGRLISSLSGPAGNILQMTNNQNIYAKILFIGALFNIVLNYILIPIYGVNGAAIASMLSLVIWNVLMIYQVRRKFGFYTFYQPFKNV